VVLHKTVLLKPNQTKLVKGTVSNEGRKDAKKKVWTMSPKQSLREKSCDIPSILLVAGTESVFRIPLYNSGSLPVLIQKGLTIGAVEEVAADDSLWYDGDSDTVRVCQMSETDWYKELTNLLQVGKSWSKRQVFLMQ